MVTIDAPAGSGRDVRLCRGWSDSVTVRSMVRVLLVVVWVAVGAAVGLYEVRRGHWRWLWLLGAMAGPLAIPLAWQANRHEPRSGPWTPDGEAGSVDRPGVRVLVGLDGSERSIAAALSIVRLLSPHLGSLTLATVVDYESMLHDASSTSEVDQGRAGAEALLTSTADELEPVLGWRPGVVVLAGTPASALERHSHDEQFDLVVIGRRGRGITKRLVGSCATALAHASPVPVVIMPTETGAAHE